jgi:hypothetical protein
MGYRPGDAAVAELVEAAHMVWLAKLMLVNNRWRRLTVLWSTITLDKWTRCCLPIGVIATVFAVPGDRIFIHLLPAVTRRHATQWVSEPPF